MPIRLRLAVAFAMIAAALYALGGWLFASGLSLTGGESQDVYEATVSQVVRELAIGGVVFVAIAALGAYWLARAALSPVVLTAITSTAGVARDRPPQSHNRRVAVSRQGRWSRPPRRCCPRGRLVLDMARDTCP